jgi:hypothetical protein
MSALWPNGLDEGREQVTLGNGTAEAVSLAGWMLRDRASNRSALTGIVPAQQPLTITMRECTMPLNNAGDDVSWRDPQGQVRHHVTGHQSVSSHPQPPPGAGSLPAEPPAGTPGGSCRHGIGAHAAHGPGPRHAHVPGTAPEPQARTGGRGGLAAAPPCPVGHHL